MNTLRLVTSIVICQAFGLLGAVFTSPAIATWYAGLNKPFFNPPNWLFAPVWTLLYLAMGVSLYLVWERKGEADIKPALVIFAVQLVLNLTWSILFFGLKLPGIALGEILVLWVVILLTIVKFWPLSKTASYLLVPYLLWVSFASLLNFSIWRLN
jgi:tryptophan-rich sensory protein